MRITAFITIILLAFIALPIPVQAQYPDVMAINRKWGFSVNTSVAAALIEAGTQKGTVDVSYDPAIGTSLMLHRSFQGRRWLSIGIGIYISKSSTVENTKSLGYITLNLEFLERLSLGFTRNGVFIGGKVFSWS